MLGEIQFHVSDQCKIFPKSYLARRFKIDCDGVDHKQVIEILFGQTIWWVSIELSNYLLVDTQMRIKITAGESDLSKKMILKFWWRKEWTFPQTLCAVPMTRWNLNIAWKMCINGKSSSPQPSLNIKSCFDVVWIEKICYIF